MKRHYYITQDLDELAVVENELHENGIDVPQVHVLSENDAKLHQYKLHGVTSIFRNDVIRSGLKGAFVGLVLAAIVLFVGFVARAETSVEWLPFSFLAVVVFGFCTWEGGLFGFQEKNSEFQRFSKSLSRGLHLMFVDVDEKQNKALQIIMNHHPRLSQVGEGSSPPEWLISSQKNWRSFIKAMP